jgi:hypothetical protein
MTAAEFRSSLDRIGWKQTDFSRRTGISTVSVSKWANGSPIPKWVPAFLEAIEGVRELAKRLVGD